MWIGKDNVERQDHASVVIGRMLAQNVQRTKKLCAYI